MAFFLKKNRKNNKVYLSIVNSFYDLLLSVRANLSSIVVSMIPSLISKKRSSVLIMKKILLPLKKFLMSPLISMPVISY